MAPEPSSSGSPPPIPLKPIVFDILLILTVGEHHGWSLVGELEHQWDDGRTILPGNLYRTLRTLLNAGLIEESDDRPHPEKDDERRRYFRITTVGTAKAREHARHLAERLAASRSANLFPGEGAAS